MVFSPGLHAHYNLDLVDKGRAEEVTWNGIIFLANGVASTWSAREYFRQRVIERRDRVDAGEAIGPRLFASGPYFGGSRYFTPYAQELLSKRGPPPPESDEAEFSQRMLELRRLYEAGGGNLLVVGTDEPVYTTLLPGFAFHRELLAMVHAGLPPAAVLKAATINGARALRIADRLGSIEAGKLADLYVARGNPLEDIKTARDVRLVIKAGVSYAPEILLESAEGKIGPAGPHDHVDWELHIKPLRQ